jgi:hypothetical protein
MTLFDRGLVVASVLLILVVLAGLLARGRAGSCWSFVLYLSAVALADALVVSSPERFWRRDFWMLKETVHNALKLAMAFELMVRIFRDFPSAYVSARRAVMVVVIALAVLIAASLARGTEYTAVVGRLHPHVHDGTVWLLVAIGGYCLWYRLPLDPVHKAILVGLVPFLLVYSVVQRALVGLGWERGYVLNATGPVAYLVLVAYWARVAWRRRSGDDSARRVSHLLAARRV